MKRLNEKVREFIDKLENNSDKIKEYLGRC
jgi:hypothetical protein